MNVIQIENLWKEYRLGVIGHGTLVHDLQSWWARLRGKEDPNAQITTMHQGQESQIEGNRFWALRDINLEVKQGEVLGIIGRNGAGKSTLLKILSRVTAPTKGCVKIKGRIASLLEVGTGFHEELTGRENIFMNGSILGMSKHEIQKKLDEIIDFSGVEDFIDTPVKRYSSGMRVRLAFAVAAHLEPEILVVDEVLAVGDAEFQKKSIGKMQKVSEEGRTVLFVSHNMDIISTFCSKGMLIESGQIIYFGNIKKTVAQYLQKGINFHQTDRLIGHPNRAKGFSELLTRFIVEANDDIFQYNRPLTLQFFYNFPKKIKYPQFVASFHKESGERVFTVNSQWQKNTLPDTISGSGKVVCKLAAIPLLPGNYYIDLRLWQSHQQLDDIQNVYQFKVEWIDREAEQAQWNSNLGSVYVDAVWEKTKAESLGNGQTD